MDLSLHRLRMLKEFARRGTVVQTAETLQYTPSAVSQQLNALERDAAVALFEHVGRRLRLTPAGRLLARHAEEILDAEERARVALERTHQTVTAELTLGVVATVAASLVPPTLGILQQQAPGITVRTREVSPEVALAAVRDGEFDMTFVLDYPETPVSLDVSLRSTVVAVEELRVATHPTQYPVPRALDLADFAEEDWIASGETTDFGRAFLAACRSAGFEPHVRHQIDDQATAMSMAAQGLGVTLVAPLGMAACGEDAQIIHVRDPPVRRLLLVRRSSTADRPSEESFVDSAVRAAEQLGIAP